MPKWVIHHTADAFTAAEKQQIANGMTQIYSSVGLPRFYSHAHFIEFPTEDIYSGGESSHGLATVAIYHVARTFENPEIQDFTSS
jgi:phenylpyruvate tautomerase PptA (4-oxalocrotonate tautomerase family)